MSIKRSALGDIIRAKRISANASQSDISEKLGIKRSTYARYETTTVPPIEILTKLAVIFNTSVDDILCEKYALHGQEFLPTKPKTSVVKLSQGSIFDNVTEAKESTDSLHSLPEDVKPEDLVDVKITKEEYEFLMFYRSCTPEQRDELHKSKE